MTLFKIKQKKHLKKKENLRVTLDVMHNKKVTQFKNQKSSLSSKKKKVKELEKELMDLNTIEKKKCTDEEIHRKTILGKEIKDIKENIHKIKNKEDEIDYFLNTSHLLFNYYELKEKNKNNSNLVKRKSKRNNSTKPSILKFFSNSNNTDDSKNTENKLKTHTLTKTDIIETYLSITNKTHIKSVMEQDDIYQCSNCCIDRILYHELGTVICPNCGEQDTILVHSDKPSYKEPPKEISCYSYKRINHFNEWLAQFQAKESTDIPQIVYDKILIEIKKERIKNIANLKPNKLREILKKLKLNKYYEHVPHIINRLNGIQAPTMSRDIEEKLRAMFKEIQTPFIKHCPKDRKNFLSYSYVLHKFVQLLGLDEYMVCFPLLKSREKLHQQDMIWKQICSDLDWEFIKSL